MKWSYLILLAAIVVITSCNKNNIAPGQKVEIYLLQSFQNIPGKCQIDPSNAVLNSTPIVGDNEILVYDADTYQMQVNDIAFEKVKLLMDVTPFAVTVDKKVIYYGYYKPSFSSSFCGHSITMDINTATQKLLFRLGYPSLFTGISIDDRRNNDLLLVTLKNQGKLK